MTDECHLLSPNLGEIDARTILDALTDGVYITNLDRRIVYWNKAAELITGFPANEVMGKGCMDNILMHVDSDGTQLCLAGCPLAKTIAEGKSSSVEVFLHHKAGHRVPVRVRVSPLTDRQGCVVGAVEVFNDNSEKLASLDRINHLLKESLLDALTLVGNRRYSEMTLRKRLDETKRYQWTFGVLFVDIDHFKRINDSMGHGVGDLILTMVAQTLAENCRTFDFVGRWGGEEFIVIAPHLSPKELLQMADRIRSLVERSSLTLDGKAVGVTVSVGGTLARPEDSTDTLMHRADRLMYQGKTAGRNRVVMG